MAVISHVLRDTKRKYLSSRPMQEGSVTSEVGTDGTTTLSRMNLSGYVGHVTIFS